MDSVAARQAGDIGTAIKGASVTAKLADGTMVRINPDFLVVKGLSKDDKLLLSYVEAKASVNGVPGRGALTDNQAVFINAFLRGDVTSTTISGSKQLKDLVAKFEATGMEIDSIDVQNMFLK